jgi:hypothetical protein
LQYSPYVNPLLTPQAIQLRKGLVRTGGHHHLVDDDNGTQEHVSLIYTQKVFDDENFVKMFAAGAAASFELNKTAQRVLALVLEAYQRTPIVKGGYCDWLELYWFGDGIDGSAIPDMSEKTFQRGLKDLIARGFLSPRNPTTFWTNPHLIFKGNRALFVTEFVRASAEQPTEAPALPQGLVAEEVPY